MAEPMISESNAEISGATRAAWALSEAEPAALAALADALDRARNVAFETRRVEREEAAQESRRDSRLRRWSDRLAEAEEHLGRWRSFADELTRAGKILRTIASAEPFAGATVLGRHFGARREAEAALLDVEAALVAVEDGSFDHWSADGRISNFVGNLLSSAVGAGTLWPLSFARRRAENARAQLAAIDPDDLAQRDDLLTKLDGRAPASLATTDTNDSDAAEATS